MTQINPELDLVLEREIAVPTELVWKAWTTPELLRQWFTPAPWKTLKCEIDLRPGGRFLSVMGSPEGEEFANEGWYLEVVENQRLVWTSALLGGFRPQPPNAETSSVAFHFTAIIEMESVSGGTRYRATVLHADRAGKETHDSMGFHYGWGKALDQLVELMS